MSSKSKQYILKKLNESILGTLFKAAFYSYILPKEIIEFVAGLLGKTFGIEVYKKMDECDKLDDPMLKNKCQHGVVQVVRTGLQSVSSKCDELIDEDKKILCLTKTLKYLKKIEEIQKNIRNKDNMEIIKSGNTNEY